MASIVLFHSILGLRDVEHQFADILRSDGHEVLLPELYNGKTAETYDAGFALKEKISDPTIHAHAEQALDSAPATAVLAGVSFGAFLVGSFWGKRSRMPGAMLLAGSAEWMTPRRIAGFCPCCASRPI